MSLIATPEFAQRKLAMQASGARNTPNARRKAPRPPATTDVKPSPTAAAALGCSSTTLLLLPAARSLQCPCPGAIAPPSPCCWGSRYSRPDHGQPLACCADGTRAHFQALICSHPPAPPPLHCQTQASTSGADANTERIALLQLHEDNSRMHLRPMRQLRMLPLCRRMSRSFRAVLTAPSPIPALCCVLNVSQAHIATRCRVWTGVQVRF
eukprot:SAG31_NODE_1546_length_7927_cov_29.239525_6_plen_210_part_00